MKLRQNLSKEIYFVTVLSLSILISSVSRPPIYGKIKFILLNTFWSFYDIAKELEQNQKKKKIL